MRHRAFALQVRNETFRTAIVAARVQHRRRFEFDSRAGLDRDPVGSGCIFIAPSPRRPADSNTACRNRKARATTRSAIEARLMTGPANQRL
jgi:hypothetical protein